MTVARLLYILGIILVVWAIISGVHFSFKMSEGGSEWDGGYSFKIGLFLLGLLLLYLGRRSSNKA